MSIPKEAMEWALGHDTGASSKALCAHMCGLTPNDKSFPRDPDDFGRCYRLLKRFPDWRDRIEEMGRYNKEWAGLSRRWPEIEDMYLKEGGELHYAKRPKTYELMQQAMKEGEREALVRSLKHNVLHSMTPTGYITISYETATKIIEELEKKQ